MADAAVAVSSTATALIDQIAVAKTFAMVVLGLGSFALGVVPIKLTKWWRKETPPPDVQQSASGGGHSHVGGGAATAVSPAMSLLLCFGGGVLLFTTQLHLQPEVREGVSRLQESGQLPNHRGTERLGDLIFCLGFFVVFLIDEIVHFLVDRFAADGHADRGSAEEVLRRSMSLRRRTMSIPRASLAGSSPPSSAPSSDANGGTGASAASIRELLKESSKPHYHHHHHHQLHQQQQQQQLQRHRNAAAVGWDAAVAGGDDGDAMEKQAVKSHDGSRGREAAGNSFRGLFAVLALSFHEVFEGLAIGLEERADNVWYLFIAVATHKLVIAFCIGMELAWSNTRRAVLVAYVATFAAVTPAGIVIGMVLVQCGTGGGAVDGAPGRVAVVLQGLAAGTLLYVVFFEVLARHKQSGFMNLLSIVLGFVCMFLLQLMTHHHSHGSVDSDHHHHHHHSVHDHSSHDHHAHEH